MPVTFDMSGFERAASRIGAFQDQIPFAVSRTLNTAADRTRDSLITDTWPRHVSVRDPNFLKAALTTKGEQATKTSLRVTIYDKLGRANLAKHETGGTATSKTGRFAIPTSRVRKGTKGVIPSQRPAQLKRKVVKNGLIFQATGKGKNQRLQLMFKLQRTNRIPATVPFHADFARFMREEVKRAFPDALARAMQTRR